MKGLNHHPMRQIMEPNTDDSLWQSNTARLTKMLFSCINACKTLNVLSHVCHHLALQVQRQRRAAPGMHTITSILPTKMHDFVRENTGSHCRYCRITAGERHISAGHRTAQCRSLWLALNCRHQHHVSAGYPDRH